MNDFKLVYGDNKTDYKVIKFKIDINKIMTEDNNTICLNITDTESNIYTIIRSSLAFIASNHTIKRFSCNYAEYDDVYEDFRSYYDTNESFDPTQVLSTYTTNNTVDKNRIIHDVRIVALSVVVWDKPFYTSVSGNISCQRVLFGSPNLEYAKTYLGSNYCCLYKLTPKRPLLLLVKRKSNLRGLESHLTNAESRTYFQLSKEGMSTIDVPVASILCKIRKKYRFDGWIHHEKTPTLSEIMICKPSKVTVEKIKVPVPKRELITID